MPTLGIFNDMSPRYRLPDDPDLAPASQAEFGRSIRQRSAWTQGHIRRFGSELEVVRVVGIPDANHDLFITEESLVVREMWRLLLGSD